MRIAIIRRALGTAFSMDVHADGLVRGLKAVRPHWTIEELVPSEPLPNRGNPWLTGLQKYWHRYWQFPIALRQQPADLFHVIDHSDGHFVYWLKQQGVPIVVTCHDLINFSQTDNIRYEAKFPLLSTALWKWGVNGLRQCDRVVSVSAHTAQEVTRFLAVPRDRLSVAPNAVDPVFRPLPPAEIAQIRQQYHLTPATTCLLNVGSNQPRKNVTTVLRAVQQLQEQGIPVQFFRTGADFTAEQKTFIHTHQLTECVRYLGEPDIPTLVKIYNAADVLVAPSLSEGFGMTLLEAMACGTPVITSNTTALPEVAGEAAVLVEPMDATAIAQAVRQLHDQPEFQTWLIQKGLDRARSFTWEHTAELVAQVYETLLQPRTHHEPIPYPGLRLRLRSGSRV